MGATRIVMHQIVAPSEVDALGICFGGQVRAWQCKQGASKPLKHSLQIGLSAMPCCCYSWRRSAQQEPLCPRCGSIHKQAGEYRADSLHVLQVLSWIDVCAGLAAKTLAHGPCVTVSVDAVHFFRWAGTKTSTLCLACRHLGCS